MTNRPYKAHKKVNAFIGPSGHGKTTIWDGLRLMLGASNFESKRSFSFYVHKKSNWSVVRVAFYNLPVNGVRPFEPIRKFKDEVTACCRIFKNEQGSWSREYYLFDGEFYDLPDIHLNYKAYSEVFYHVEDYLKVLEQCMGITKEFRNLMARSPDDIREVVNSSPHKLFQLLFDLKGTKDYKKRYDDSKQRLNEQEVAIERAEEEMEQAKSRFEETKRKAQNFRLYQAKEKAVQETTIKLKKLEYFESRNALKSIETEMTAVEEQGKIESDKVNEFSIKINAKLQEIGQFEDEYQRLYEIEEQANENINKYTTDKTRLDVELERLTDQIKSLKQIEPQNLEELNELKGILTEDLGKKRLDYLQAKEEINQLKQKLADLEQNVLPYKEEAKRFRIKLEENKIPYIMLADAISVKPEMRQWQKSIEAYIGNNRYRIIVEQDKYLPVKRLQQEARYGARVSLPKKEKAFRTRTDIPYPSIRSALTVNCSEKVEGYLEGLNHIYLVETVDEGHALQERGIDSITLEGLLQDGDGAIHLKYHSLCCGKLALDEEKKETQELLPKKEAAVEDLLKSVNELQGELDEVTKNIKNQELIVELPEMEDKRKLLQGEVEKLSSLIGELTEKKDLTKKEKETVRQKEIEAREEKVKFNEKKDQAFQRAADLSQKYTELRNKLSSLISTVERAYKEVKGLGLSEDDIAFISYEVQGSAFIDAQGSLYTSKEISNTLNSLRLEKERLHNPSVNEETIRLVEAQEGQIGLLIQNLHTLKKDREDLERTCNDLLLQFRGHIKEIMKNYVAEFESFADLLKASAKGKLVEVTPEPETWEIHLFIGYDGKEPVAVDGPHLSSGQKASTSLMILLAALSDNKNGKITPIMFLDEPKARVDDERGNEIGQLLQVTDIQYFITHQQGESLKSIDWIDHAFTCSACEPSKEFANQLILKKRANRPLYAKE